MNELHRMYAERAAFYIVYIEEAHPIDGWQMAVNVRDSVLFANPHTLEDRCEIAGSCARDLGIEFPALVDGADNAVERAYTGWPDRLYVVDPDGRIAYKSAPGPFGFDPAGVKLTLGKLLPDSLRVKSAASGD